MAKRKKIKPVLSPTISKEFIDRYYSVGEVVPQELFKNNENIRDELRSLEYKIFKQRNQSLLSRIIVGGSSTVGKVIHFSIDKEQEKKTNTLLYLLGYDFSAKDLYGFGVSLILFGFIIGILVSILGQVLVGVFLIALGIGGFFGVQYFPKQQMMIRLSKSSSDLVTMILYLVIYMRQTPNLEAAVQFASDNLGGYIAYDLKKLIWDTAARRYTDIKEALDDYSQRWVKSAPAFTDALFLIESSVSQETEDGRLEMLDEASSRVLSGTFETMTEYASTLKEPLNTVYMLGMVLPVLGLVLAPMMMAFVSIPDFGVLLPLMYDVGLPLMVYFLIREKLLVRPAGFSAPDISQIPDTPPVGSFFLNIGSKKVLVNAIWPAVGVFLAFMIPAVLLFPELQVFGPTQIYISMLITAAVGFSVVVYFKLSVMQLKDVESELIHTEASFSSALFQIGSYLSQGFPPEATILKVADVMKNTPVAEFFSVTTTNIKQMGMSLKDAFFDKTYGSTKFFPSSMMIATMRVFIESARKSVGNASAATMYISRHLENLKRINQQVKSLLEEVTSGMRVEVGLLSPVMAGIVVGLTTLIGTVLQSLSGAINTIQTSVTSGASSGPGGIGSVVPFAFSLFNLSGGQIPLYDFQLVIAIYLITLSGIIAYAISTISQPGDQIVLRDNIANMVLISVVLYILIASIVTLVLGSVGGLVLGAIHIT